MLAIVAPGQGAQTPGFLEPWVAEPTFAERLGWLSAVSGLDLVHYGTKADADTIRDTAVAQPLLVAAGLLASIGALLISSVASAQEKETMLAVRGIDGTDQANVGVTFLYTGAPQELENLTIREDGQEMKIKDLTNLSKTDQGLRTIYLVDTSGSMGDDGALSDVKKGLESMANSLPAGDEAAIISFNDAAVVETGFTQTQNDETVTWAGGTPQGEPDRIAALDVELKKPDK